MGGDLAPAVGIFLASAASVIFLGTKLAKYGDALATITGWGRLFVGSILVAMATSLPELSTSISAVRLPVPNPELSLGNVLGANMINMFTMAMVSLVFGGQRFLQNIAPEQTYLILVATLLTALTVIFAAVRLDFEFWSIGLTSVVLLVVFVLGMRIVYNKRPKEAEGDGVEEDPGMTAGRAWLMFALVSVGVVIAGFFLAYSMDRISEITGIASSALGILAASIVTTMPEATATIAAARMGAADLGIGNLYGSCAFNVTILSYADPFYRQGIILNHSEPSHFVAGGIAVFLLLFSLLLILGCRRLHRWVVAGGLALMAAVYLAGALQVASTGAPSSSGGVSGPQQEALAPAEAGA